MLARVCSVLVSLWLVPSAMAMSEQEQTLPFQGNWSWTDNRGALRQSQIEINQDMRTEAEQERIKVSFSLAYPVQALSTYLTPRLNYAVKMIRRHQQVSQEHLVEALRKDTVDLNDPAAMMMWDAYEQYKQDAYRHLIVKPCQHPDHAALPCVRPNYSQLFYLNRGRLGGLAQQLHSPLGPSYSLENAKAWLGNIPEREETRHDFASPLNVLTSNSADSDERALLLAVLMSRMAPGYTMHMLYPEGSIGSVSPAWLTIDASSGIEGVTVIIDERPHTVISGPHEQIQQALLSKTKLVSDALY
ncbi:MULTISPECIES: hypothetical protein [Aliagarivorans]|uniref:hypothetical protein n=1 Tax=Aliagarivorans TaxID=882379 RepID=UPI00068879B2|nr:MULTISPECIES: hypothetical protein [Aliagarivorans]